MIIENSTAPTIVLLLVDEKDAITGVSGLIPNVELSKNGGAFTPVAGTVTSIAHGWYRVTLTPAETDIDGPLVMRAWADGTLEWRDIHQVYSDLTATLAEAVFDRIADHVLRRHFGNAAGSTFGDEKAFRSLLGAVAKDVNRVQLNGATLEIYQEDDSTVLGTQQVVANANATPITGIDTD